MPNRKLISPLIGICTLLIVCTSCKNDRLIYNPDTKTVCVKNIRKLDFTIELDTPKIQLLPDIVECEGRIEPSVTENINVSVPIQGIIKRLLVTPGAAIKKGTVIAVIENPEILKMQEDYLIKKSEFDYYREDFKRQGELNLEDATSMKIMQQAELNYNRAEASLQSLKKRLQLIGINADSIVSENMQSIISVTAPIYGTVSTVDAVIGMFCTMQNTLCTITNNQKPVLKINLTGPVKIILDKGMPVEFITSNDPTIKYHATIKGITPDKTSNILIIYAEPDETMALQLYTTVKALIIGNKKNILTVNSSAIVQDENKTYLLLEDTLDCFRIAEITCGRSWGNTTEIIRPIEELKNHPYVTKGEQGLYWYIKQQLMAVR